jgi:PAS domain S-box-containing protein
VCDVGHDELLVVVIDVQGGVEQINAGCTRATGWRCEDLRGAPIWRTLFPHAGADDIDVILGRVEPHPATRFTDWARRDGAPHAVCWAIARLPGSASSVVVARSVAAGTAAEAYLRESEATFRTLAETTTATIFIHRDHRIIYVNPASEALTGYSRDELLAMDFWDLVHPTMRDAARRQGAERLRGEVVPVRNEVKLVTKSGEERWVEFAAAMIRHGGHTAVVGTAFDITERCRAQAVQRNRERRFRALIEHSSDVVSVVGIDGRLTYVGPSVRRVLGHAPEDLIGRSILDLVHEDDRAILRQGMRDAMSRPGEPITVEYRLRHADGSWRWTEGVGTNLLHEPMVGGIIANVRDVTDRRRAEALLRESERRFALAVDGAQDGIWDWDIRGDTFYASPRMRAIMEIESTQAPRVSEVFGERVHPDDLPHIHERWKAHVESRDTHYAVEYRLRSTDGTYRWVSARGATVRDANGAPYRMVGSLTDITSHKRAQEDARQRQAELAHVLRVSAMGEMAASLAHELNQPLAAIVNYARGCARRLAGSDGAPPEVLEALDRIATEALRAGDVVRGLKRVVRKEPPREMQTDLNDVAREAMALVRPEASDREIRFLLELSIDPPRVRADRVQIEQVVLNLLRNAVEAITQPPGLICLSTVVVDGRAVVTVSDTGHGISADLLERVFAPFFTTKTSGLGMGLSISRTIIEAHGGRLWAEANADAGMTFSFTLTLDDGDGRRAERVGDAQGR